VAESRRPGHYSSIWQFHLDNIWYYIAARSGSMDTADRVADSITHRFYALATQPNITRALDVLFGG
jgi:hypothetical protein